MADAWKQNEEKNEEEELAVTDHRDAPAETELTERDESSVETPSGDGQAAMQALGEDVASSPAARGQSETRDE